MPLDYNEFAEKIKQKYPAYKDVDNYELATKMVEKYPEYKDQVVLKKKASSELASKSGGPTLVSSSREANGQKYVAPKQSTPTDSTKAKATTAGEGEILESKNAKYRYHNGKWYAYTDTTFDKKTGAAISNYNTQINNSERIKTLDKMFNKADYFKGYPGKEDKEYRLKYGIWQEQDPKTNSFKPITDPTRVNTLNNYFKQEADTDPYGKTFVGYPGKESNEYRISESGAWQRKQKGQREFQTITDDTAIKALNKQFNQNVGTFSEEEKAKVEAESKARYKMLQNINSITSDLLMKTGSDVTGEYIITGLEQNFPGFKFDKSRGMLTSELEITSPSGNRISVNLEKDPQGAQRLRAWMREESQKDVTKAQKDLSRSEYQLDMAQRQENQQSKYESQPNLKPIVSTVTDATGEKINVTMNTPQTEVARLEAEKREVTKQYVANKSQQLRDTYSAHKDNLSSPEAKAAFAAIKHDDTDIRVTNDYVNDIKNSYAEYGKKTSQFDAYVTDVQAKLKSGEITQEQYESLYKPNIDKMKSDLDSEKSSLSKEVSNLTNASRGVEKSIAENYILDEAKGGFLNTMAFKAIRGTTYLPRLLSMGEMTAEDQDAFARWFTGDVSTKAYMESEKRNDVATALFSVAESLGALASSAPLEAVGLANLAINPAFHAMSYYESKDQLDKIPGISEVDKVLMSSIYGVVSGALETFGIETALQRTPFGKNLTNNIMKNLFSSLPKNAPREFIDAAITNSVTKTLTALGIEAGVAATTEGLTEAAQSLSQASINEVYDMAKKTDYFNNKGAWDVLGNALYEGYLGALGGGIMNAAHSTPQVISNGLNATLNKDQIALLIQSAKTEGMDDALLTNLKADIISGKISRDEAIAINNSFREVKGKIESMPNEMSTEQKSVALDLMLEKDKLEKQIEGKDPNLVEPQKKRVDEINDRLKQIGKDAVQKQTTGEVPVQPETGVSEEVEGGVSQPATEQVTKEGEQAKTEEIKQEEVNQYLGEPIVTTVDDGELYQFRTEDGLIGGVMVSPTEFRIDGISANEVGKGQGSKMFESLIDYLKSKGVTKLTTVSAGEGAIKMHDKAVEKGLLTKTNEEGRTAEFIINQAPVAETETAPSTEAELDFEVTPEVTQEADALEKLLSDEGITVEAPVVEQVTEQVTEEAPVTEEPVVEETVVEETPSQPISEMPLTNKDLKALNQEKINTIYESLPKETKEKYFPKGVEGMKSSRFFYNLKSALGELKALKTIRQEAATVAEDTVLKKQKSEKKLIENKRKELLSKVVPTDTENEVSNFPLTKGADGVVRYIPEAIARKAYNYYNKNVYDGQSFERVKERGGFGMEEMDKFYPNWRNEIPEAKDINKRADIALKKIKEQTIAEPISKTEQLPVVEETKPTEKPKANKKLTVKEMVQKYNDHIDSLIKAEKERSDRRIAQIANQRNSAREERRSELTQQMDDLRFAFSDKKRNLEKKKNDKQAAKDFNENPARFRMSEGTQEEADTRNDEQAIIDKMNEASAEEKGLNRGEVPAEVEVNPIEESSSLSKGLDKVLKFLGLKDKNSLLKRIQDFNGIPMILGMSDMLAAGTIKDSMGGDMVVDGGLLYNTLGKNVDLAWAGVTEDGANNQVKQARELYEANKELFDRLWAEGKIPQGHVPMAIMRMGNTAVNSNEAVFRYLLPYVKSLPLKNRTAALRTYLQTLQSKAEGNAASYWFTELEDQIETGNLTTKEQVIDYLTKLAEKEQKAHEASKKEGENAKVNKINSFIKSIKKNKDGQGRTIEDIKEDVKDRLEKIIPFMLSNYIKSNKIKTLDAFLEAVVDESKKRAEGQQNIFSLPIRSFIFNSLISPESTKGANSLEVIKTLLDGVKKADPTIFTSKHIYNAIGEPSMLKANKGDVVGIMGIKVIDENGNPAGGVKKAEHNNYGYGPEGKIIALIENPKPGIDVFPEFRAKLARVFKPSKTGKYPTIENAVDQTGGAFFMDAAFRGTVPAVEAMTDLKVLIGKLRFAFPEVSVATTQEEFDNFLEQEGIRAREKDGKIIYGVTKDGRIFLNPSEQTLRTPIHEFGHIWIDYLRSEASGTKGDMLLQKGFELVDGTPEYERALKEYGSRELALEEALVELMAVKGDTIANAAKKSQFLEWMNAMFKYIKETMVRSKDFAQSKIKDLTLDEFINIGLADLFSGERVSGKFDARTAGEGSRARFSRSENISKIIDIAAKNGVSNEAVKLLLARQGFSISDINAAFVKKAAPIKKGKVSKVTVNEKTALKDQIRLEARAAREAKKDLNEKRKALGKVISDMETTGKITTKQAQVLMDRISKLNMDNPAKVDAFVEYAGRVFENAEFAQNVSRARSLQSKVKVNAKTKLGIANDLISEILVMASINPSLIPSNVFDTYMETMEMLGQRTAVLKLEERGELTQKVSDILNAVNEELSVASEMADRFEAYEKKEVDSEGKIDFAKTLDKMVNDGTITKEEADIMRKYKSEIISKESTKMSEEEIAEEKKTLLGVIKKDVITDEAIRNLPSRLERMLAKSIQSLLKTNAVNSLDNTTLKNLLKLVDNINNGFVPHYAQKMKERLTAIDNNPTLETSIKKGNPLRVGSLASKIKSLITKRNYVLEMIRSTALGNIDQVFGDFKTNNIFKSVFEGSAKGIAAFNSEFAKINDKLEEAKLKVAESLGKDPNKVTMSAFKTMAYLLQLEKESNPDSKQVNNAVDFINATIDQIEKGASSYTEMDAEFLQEILDKYTDKETGQIDTKKLYNSFNSAEKAAIKTIQEVNDSMTEKAVYTAGIIRGDKINPIANYVPHVVLEEAIPGKEITGANDVANFSNSRKPSTKAKNLVERTGAVTAISFNPYQSTQNAAKNVLLDFHMTEPIRIARMTINETRKSLEKGKITPEQRMFLNAISNAYEEATQHVLASSFQQNELLNELVAYISRAGYKAVLGTSVTRTASELLSNMSAVVLMDPKAFGTGVKEFSNFSNPEEGLDIMLNVGSSQTERVMGGNTQGGMLIDPAISKRAVGMKDTKAKNKLASTMQMIYNRSLKRPANWIDLTSDVLMSSPDTIVTRPTWFGSFANEFEKVAGKKVDFDKIKANDEAYINENADAIKAAKDKADKAVFNLSATNNAYMGLLKNNISPDSHGLVKAVKVFDNYLTRFTTYEYLNARTAIYALAGQGMISKKEAVGLLAGVTTRMITYSLLTKALSAGLISLFTGGGDDEDDDKTFMQKLGQAAASAASTMLIGRNFGNIVRNIAGYGVEKINEKYLTALREGDYDAYQDAIQFTVVPQDKKGEMGQGVDMGQMIFNMLGPASPFVKSLAYGIEKLTEKDRVAPKASDSDAVKAKRREAVLRQQRERNIRVPLELTGTLGFVPFYKDIRKIVNDVIYADLKKSLKEQEANKKHKEEMLMGYDSKSDMELENPKLYERLYEKGGKYYREEEIRMANENLKNSLRKIEKELRSGEINYSKARILKRRAQRTSEKRIRKANR